MQCLEQYYGYIYLITNLVNQKIYIGQRKYTVDKHNGGIYLGAGFLIKKAVKKYGKKNFKKEIIDYVISGDEANAKEIYWINEFNSTHPEIGYNICKGGRNGCSPLANHPDRLAIFAKIAASNKGKKGSCPMLGKHHTQETKDKISNSKQGNIPWNKGTAKPKVKKEMVSWNKGKKGIYSEETIEKIRNGARGNKNMLGKKHSEESINKMKESHKGSVAWNEMEIAQIDRAGSIVFIYRSRAEAARATGAQSAHIIAKNKRGTSGGFIWRYTKDLTEGEIERKKVIL